MPVSGTVGREAGEEAAVTRMGHDQRPGESPGRSEKRIAESCGKMTETVKSQTVTGVSWQKSEFSGSAEMMRAHKAKALWRNDVQVSFPGLRLSTSPCCQSCLPFPGFLLLAGRSGR